MFIFIQNKISFLLLDKIQLNKLTYFRSQNSEDESDLK